MYRNGISHTCACKISIVRVLLVSLFWITGFLLGSFLGSQLEETNLMLLRNIIRCRVSFLSLFFVLFFPFALSALFLRLPFPLLTLSITFTKALLVGFCACGIIVAFSSAGWLIRLLLLFSDSFIVILLLWFWIRNIAFTKNQLNTDTSICAVLTFIISCIDYFAVSPFLDALLNI